jgi:kynurenine formamidase
VEFFDLTQPLTPGMTGFPGDPAVQLVGARSHEVDGYQVTQICVGSHSGTHLDAPRHFVSDGETLDCFPLERLIGPGIVVDCRPLTKPLGGQVTADFLAECLLPFPIHPGGFVLLNTGGALLSVEAARLLLDGGAGLVGTDAPSLDEEPYPVHKLLLGHGVLLAENLRGLDRIEPGPVTCACLPLAVVGTDGAPARIVAWR